MMLKNYFKGILQDRYILINLVKSDLRAKYRNSVLGVAWSVITPLGMVVIIGSVYSIIFGNDPKMFIPQLFAGLIPWIFINLSADGGTGSLLSAEGYLKQTNVNAQIFPIRITLGAFVNLLYGIITFFGVYLLLQPKLFNPKMLMILPGLILLLLFGISLSNISAVLNLNVRDFQPLQSLILQSLFYVTPIIYPAEILKEKGFEMLYRVNPIYYLLEIVRQPMLGKELPSLDIYVIAIIIVGALFASSIFIIMKEKKGMALKL